MSFLKGLAIGLLNSLLLLLMLVFGLALTLNMTVKSADFVTSQLDELDISSLAEEVISQQSPEEGLPEEFRAALVDIIPDVEPLLKEQLTAAIYPVYDYLKGKSPELDLADILYDTILSPDLVTSLIEEVDIHLLVEDWVEDFLIEEATGEVTEEVAYVVGYIDDAIAELEPWLEPWLKEQLAGAIQPIYDYLLGKSQSLRLPVSLEPLIEQLRNPLWEAFRESPPPELAGQSEPELEQYFNDAYEDIARQIPSTFELTEDVLNALAGTDIPAQVAEALSEAEEALEQARQYIGYFQTGFVILIVLMLLSVAGIALINREVRGTSRILGITLLSFGTLELIGIFIARRLAEPLIPWDELPTTLQTWLQQLIGGFMAPAQVLSIVLIVVGTALLAVSFIYQRDQFAE